MRVFAVLYLTVYYQTFHAHLFQIDWFDEFFELAISHEFPHDLPQEKSQFPENVLLLLPQILHLLLRQLTLLGGRGNG